MMPNHNEFSHETEPAGGETAVSENQTGNGSGQPADTPPELSPADQLTADLAAARADATRNLDGWMRSQAELANARKRFEKQQAESFFTATAEVIKKLLPALDDFDRAISNAPAPIQADGWFEGIILVQRKLNTLLESFNVTTVAALGQPFDPNLHEAILQEASDTYPSGHVTRELQKGYRLGDRIIRPALVYVAE